MKIAYLSSSIIPSRAANSVHVMKMCQAFSNNGHEVILYAPDNPNIENGVENPYKFYGVDECFEIKKMPWFNIKGKNYLFSFLTSLDARKRKPDLAYGRNLASCYFSALLGLTTVYEAHQPINKSNKMKEYLFSKLIKSKNFKELVVISDSLKNYYLKNYKIDKEKIIVAHDGADMPNKLNNNELINFGKGSFDVGYIGQLYSGKGMEIISKLVEKCDWAHFHIVGGTEDDIRYWKNRMKNYNNITFYGYIPNSETDKFRQSFDIVLAPYQKEVSTHGSGKSNIAEWMSPLKIFEYMAAGKAIVASDLHVLKEILQNKKNALLCNPDDIVEWIEAMKILKDNPTLKNKISFQAYKTFKHNYTWENRAKKILKFI